VDEQKLTELFRDAASDAPPPSFDVDGVRSASARATAKRRSAIALGSTMALVLVLGGVVATTNLVQSNSAGDTAAAGSYQEASSPNVSSFTAAEPEMIPKDASPDRSGGIPPKSIPEDPSTQGDEPSGSADPRVGSAQRGCVEVDRELAVALADELPVANASQAAPATAECPTGGRGASFLVRDGAVYGTVSVVVAPLGTMGPAPDDTFSYAGVKTPDGEELYVVSQAAEGSSDKPFANRLQALAERLAARL
jgi:hypothetical protein